MWMVCIASTGKCVLMSVIEIFRHFVLASNWIVSLFITIIAVSYFSVFVCNTRKIQISFAIFSGKPLIDIIKHFVRNEYRRL